jgi:N-acetylneuraminic acid mutarotase
MSGADQDNPVPPGAPGPGSAPYNSDPYYGTLGVPGVANVPGGRNSAAYWTDKNTNLWLFGGDGLDGSPGPIEGLLNDLWMYSPPTNEWTWIGGSSTLPAADASCPLGPGFCGLPGVYGSVGTPSPSNNPGGRKLAVSWIDSAGNLWLFGGFGIDSTGNLGYLNDLWEFNSITKEWAWISGSSSAGEQGIYGTQGVASAGNVPPGLCQAVGWIGNGKLWVFGGTGLTSTGVQGYDFNNLWQFDPSANEWAWISGTGASDNVAYGVYGTIGISAPGNTPSGRHGATSWTDSSGTMWLFGGYGVYPESDGVVDLENDLNELWEFSPTSNQWTWVAGTAGGVPNSFGNPGPPSGSYGTLGVASPNNHPGGRDGGTGWVDDAGNFWLFGGEGNDSTGTYGALNDLWEFSSANKQWTWVGGDNTAWQGAVYGVEGTPAAANMPGARYNSASWIDSSGGFWLFAGWGILDGATGGSTVLNDLWRYQP